MNLQKCYNIYKFSDLTPENAPAEVIFRYILLKNPNKNDHGQLSKR